MAELGPWMITARNRAQAEYLVRSRAEQRGVPITGIDVSGGDGDRWVVSVTVSDTAAMDDAARLADDTQTLHLDIRRGRSAP